MSTPAPDLPEEVMQIMFEYLPEHDIALSCALVSRSWHRAAMDPVYWQQRFGREFGPTLMETAQCLPGIVLKSSLVAKQTHERQAQVAGMNSAPPSASPSPAAASVPIESTLPTEPTWFQRYYSWHSAYEVGMRLLYGPRPDAVSEHQARRATRLLLFAARCGCPRAAAFVAWCRLNVFASITRSAAEAFILLSYAAWRVGNPVALLVLHYFWRNSPALASMMAEQRRPTPDELRAARLHLIEERPPPDWDMFAHFVLGLAWFYGYGAVAVDVSSGTRLWHSLARQGFAPALYWHTAHGNYGDVTELERWYGYAAQQGYGPAQEAIERIVAHRARKSGR